MKYIKITNVLILFLLVFQFTNLKAEVVSPTFKSSKSLVGVVNDPSDVDFSPDGTKIFISGFSGLNIKQFTVTTPFDITTIDTSSVVTLNLNSGDDNISTHMQGFAFNDDGTKIYSIANINSSKGMSIHTLTTPYDLSTASQDTDDGINWDTYLDPLGGGARITQRDIEFNNDGTKMYLIHAWLNETMIEYNLSTPFVPSSASLGTVLDLNDINQDVIQDFEFDDDGTRMYLQESGAAVDTHKIYVYKLSTPFAISSAKYVGRLLNFFKADGTGQALPLGLDFSADGMKLYQVAYSHNGDTDPPDFIYQYDLKCPYGIVICEEDTLTNTGAQVEFAKHVIQQNTSTVFKRFEWLRRNEGKNNLNNLTASIKLDNPLLNYWIKKLPTKIESINGAVKNGRSITIGHENKNSNNLDNFTTVIKSDNPLLNSWMNKLPEKITAHKASLSSKKIKKDKNSNWSYWSHGDISFGRKGDTATSKPKEVRVSGLMFGADKKLNNNKFVGGAIRLGKGEIESITPNGIKLDTEALSFNLYGTLPVNNNSNLNALLGFSFLRLDQLTSLDKISGERNGKQVFTAINMQSKDGYGNYNLRPTGTFEFGVTQFSEYTDFGTSTNSQDSYDSLTFKTGNIAAGFKFDNFIDINNGRLSRNGGLEYVQDLTSNIDYNFKNNSDNASTTKTVETHSIHNIKGNFGFEILYESGYTFALNYERFQGLDYSSHQDSIFIKFGHIREEDSDFALNYKPLENNQMELSYVKDVNGFDVKVSSNYSLMNEIPDYGANIEVSSVF